MPAEPFVWVDDRWRGSDSEIVPEFVMGETKPDAANTGLIDADVLTTVTGNQTHAANDAVFQNIRFTGKVSVTGKRITYVNCWFNAPHTVSQALAQCSNANCEDIEFDRCLFRPASYASDAVGALANCVFGHDFTLVRCDLSGCIDLVGLYSGNNAVPARNVGVLGCYLHDMTYYSPDPSHGDNQTHNDAIQVHHGAADFTMFGSRIDATIDPAIGQAPDEPVTGGGGQHISGNKNYPAMVAMSAVMMSPVNATAGVNGFAIDKSWLGQGIVVVNWPRADGTGVTIVGNRWTRGSLLGDDWTILMKSAQPATVAGNYFEDTLEPWNGRKNG